MQVAYCSEKLNSTKWEPPPSPQHHRDLCRGAGSYLSLPCLFLKGRIQDFLVSDSVDLNTALVFVSVIYFKGIWKTAFKEEYTQEEPFNVTEVGGHRHTSGQGSCWLTQAGVWGLQISVTHWGIFLSPSLSVSRPKAK